MTNEEDASSSVPMASSQPTKLPEMARTMNQVSQPVPKIEEKVPQLGKTMPSMSQGAVGGQEERLIDTFISDVFEITADPKMAN